MVQERGRYGDARWGEGMTTIWSKSDDIVKTCESLTKIWWRYDKHLVKIWWKSGKAMMKIRWRWVSIWWGCDEDISKYLENVLKISYKKDSKSSDDMMTMWRSAEDMCELKPGDVFVMVKGMVRKLVGRWWNVLFQQDNHPRWDGSDLLMIDADGLTENICYW